MLEETGCELLVFGPDLAEWAAALGAEIPALACHGLGARLDDGCDLLADAENASDTAPAIDVSGDDVILTRLLRALPAH
ncbi:MAG TPA: hypothetical protein VF226_03770 [Hyphomicrobiaceae bacterium]